MHRAIPDRESLTVEFKSDRARLPDRELVAAVTCLANTEGGELYVGIEDDGTVSGLHLDHQSFSGVVALIANRTVPSLAVRAEVSLVDGMPVGKIVVPKSKQLIATSDGLLQRRRLRLDGTPECGPLFPHEMTQRQADLGLLDYSALPVLTSSLDDFDPLERERLRQNIERYGGDRSLLNLADRELDGALGFVRRESGNHVPTVTGLLVIGRESALRQHLPTHEVAFQVLDGTEVRVNEFMRSPLLRVFDFIEQQFRARVIEQEFQSGLFRVSIPSYDSRAFREAVVNALVHRDYTQLGAVHVRWEIDALIVSNPGGFVEGVNLDNLLVTEPRPRNPLLADALKRIGLAERTGRGIDLIFQGLLRYGRAAPDYRRSDSKSVVVILPGGEADIGLLQTVIEEERRTHHPLPVDTMIALGLLRAERRIETRRLAQAIQKDEATARTVLERLVETGLVEAHGIKKGRTYTLSRRVYQGSGQPADYVRQAGFDSIQQEQMVLQFVQAHARITRKDASELCRISEDQASRMLRKLMSENKLHRTGRGRSVSYSLP